MRQDFPALVSSYIITSRRVSVAYSVPDCSSMAATPLTACRHHAVGRAGLHPPAPLFR